MAHKVEKGQAVGCSGYNVITIPSLASHIHYKRYYLRNHRCVRSFFQGLSRID